MTEIAEVKSRLSTVYVFGRKKQMSGLQRKEINQMRKWNKRLLSGCLLAALLLSMSGCQQGNTTSSAVSSQAVSSAAASSEETTEGPVETYHDMPVQTLDLDPSDPDYYQKALETELYNYKLIRNVPTAYQAESWDAYTATANTLLNIDRGVPEVWGSVYDIRELLDSSVKLMDGKSPLEISLPGPLNALKKPLLRVVKGTVIEKVLRDHNVIKEGMI